MAPIQRVRVALAGFPGGPGVSTFYALDGAALQAPLRAFYDAVTNYFSPGYTATVELGGDTIEASTGVLSGGWSGSGLAVVNGGAGGPAFAGPAGLTVTWNTISIADGSRIKGRTFMVPLHTMCYDTDGTITGAALNAFRTAASTFVTAAATNFVVWHRPLSSAAGALMKPPRPAHDGSIAPVTSSSVPDRVAVLRSRR